ncbi:MAG: efflux RND transporter periplasmic adaptor subunit [Chitinophagaceae bacterium]
MTRTPEYKYTKGFIPYILLMLIVTSCNEQQAKTAVADKVTKTDSIKAFILQTDSVKKAISIPGDLLPDETAQIRAKAQGYIKKLNVDIGSKVTKGQVLALIDAPEIDSRIQELNEKVRAAKSRYLSSRDYYERISIAAKADGVIAPNELERTKNQMMADSSDYNAAVFAASSYRQIGNYLAVIAPYNGTITKRNIVVGSFVGNANEQPLFELENNKTLRLRVSIPEIYTNAVLLNNTGELTTRSLPDKKFKAKLARKAGSIDNSTRSEVWEFEIANTNGELKAGSYADVKMQFLRSRPSFVVPVSAVTTTLERKFVIRVTNNSTEWVDVRAGFNIGDRQEIFGELNIDDTLVLKGNEEVKSGLKVVPIIVKP